MNDKINVRLAVVGSRTFSDAGKCYEILNKVRDENNYNYVQVVSGGARGADTYGEYYAEIQNIPKLIFKADWKKFGKRAGFIRNVDIIKNCDVCVAFWDGMSHGTKHDLELCKEHNKECFVYNFVTGSLYKDN